MTPEQLSHLQDPPNTALPQPKTGKPPPSYRHTSPIPTPLAQLRSCLARTARNQPHRIDNAIPVSFSPATAILLMIGIPASAGILPSFQPILILAAAFAILLLLGHTQSRMAICATRRGILLRTSLPWTRIRLLPRDSIHSIQLRSAGLPWSLMGYQSIRIRWGNRLPARPTASITASRRQCVQFLHTATRLGIPNTHT